MPQSTQQWDTESSFSQAPTLAPGPVKKPMVSPADLVGFEAKWKPMARKGQPIPDPNDPNMVTVPIPRRDLGLLDAVQGQQGDEGKKKGLFSGLKKKISHVGEESTIMVRMSREEYRLYWARGEDGRFLPEVIEPVEGRAEWVQRHMEGQ